MSAAEQHKNTFVPFYRLTSRLSLLTVVINLLALLMFRFDLLSSFATQLIGGFSGDGGLYLWLFKHNANFLLSEPWFNTNALYPYSETLAWSDNFIFPSLIGKIFLSYGLSEIISYNLILISAMALNGIFTARLCYHLSGQIAGALFAGALFMGSAYLASVVGHPQLQFAFWIPLATDLFFRFLNSRHPFHALLLGGCITLAFLTTVYYSLFIILLCLALSVGVVLLRPREIRPFEVLKLAIFGALGCLPLLFFSAPYLDVQATFGERHLYEPYYFSATLLSYLSSASSSILYPWTASWSEEEAHLFCGVVPFALLIPLWRHLAGTASLKKQGLLTLLAFALSAFSSCFGRVRPAEIATLIFSWTTVISAAFFLRKLGVLERKLGADYLTLRALAALFSFLLILFFSISLGPLGNPALNTSALGIFRVFYEIVPGFASVRAISRIGLLCIFSLAVLSTFSLQLISRTKKISAAWLVIGAVLLFAENLNYPHAKEGVPLTPSAVKLLGNRHQSGEVTAFLPYSGSLKESGEISSWKDFARIQVSAMNWSLNADLRTINGYSGQQTKLMRELPRELAGFPSERALRALRQFAGLRNIVYIPEFAEDFNHAEFDLRLRYFREQLQLVEIDPAGNYLFELIGEESLSQLPSLIVPSFPPRVVSLQLKTRARGNDQARILPIFIHTHFENNPFSTLKVAADGEFHWYSLSLPLTSDMVRPLRLIFKGDDLESLVIGKVLVSSESDRQDVAQPPISRD